MSNSATSSSGPANGPWLFPAAPPPGSRIPGAVLFDRDGTLIEDVPYNGDPALVRPLPGARTALGLLRGKGIATGVVSNQSGVARGLLTRDDVDAVRRRVETLLGPFDVWAICPHAPADACRCRKPAPGLIHAACAQLGLPPHETAVVGDIAADTAAAYAACARALLVPTPATRPEETSAAQAAGHYAPDLLTAVHTLLTPVPGNPYPSGHAPPDPLAGPATHGPERRRRPARTEAGA